MAIKDAVLSKQIRSMPEFCAATISQLEMNDSIPLKLRRYFRNFRYRNISAKNRYYRTRIPSLLAIHGWTSPEQLIYLMKAIRALPDCAIAVEIGVWQGRSALSMAESCRGTRKKVYAVDPWLDDSQSPQSLREVSTSNVLSFQEAYLAFLTNLQHFELQEWCIPIRDTSLNVAKAWQNGLIDLIFIDGSHEYDAVVADLEAWIPLIKTGGIICGDDWSWPTVRSAVLDFAKRHQNLQLDLPCTNTWCTRA